MEPKQWMNRKSWTLHLEVHLWNGKYCHQLRSLIATVITNKFKIQVCLLYFLSCFLYFSHKNENIKILLNNYEEKTWTKLRQGCTVVVLCGILSSHIWKNLKLYEKGLDRKRPLSQASCSSCWEITASWRPIMFQLCPRFSPMVITSSCI